MRKPRFFIVLLLLLAATVLAQSPSADSLKLVKIHEMYQAYKQRAFPKVPDVTVAQVLQWQKQGKVVLVDVRSDKERRVSVIPSAISRKQFEKEKERYKDANVVAYCTIGYRSGTYVKKAMKKRGRIFNLIGGVLAWSHAGQPFASANGDSLRVHVYGAKWNLLPEKYRGVWK